MGLSPVETFPLRWTVIRVSCCSMRPLSMQRKAERASSLASGAGSSNFGQTILTLSRDGQRARARYARGDLRRCGGRSRSGNACGYVRRGAQRVSEHARKDKGIAEGRDSGLTAWTGVAPEDSRYTAFGLRRTSSCHRETYSRQDGQRSPSAVAQIVQKSLMDGLL